jgi:hypothetical protein
MDIVMNKNLSPKLRITARNEISGLLLEHGVVIGNRDKFVIAKDFRVNEIS